MEYLRLFVELMSGMGVFLWGMRAMSNAIKRLMGDGVKRALTRLTVSPLSSVGIGAGTTALLHSSSAVTLMTIGFVNAGAMPLKNAVYIIMGANIGTTVTGFLVALEAFDLSFYLSLLSIVGLIVYSATSKERTRSVGVFLAGLGLIFCGLEIMGVASKEIAQIPLFLAFFTSKNSPFLLLMMGALLASILQSSTAVNGVIIMLAGANGISVLDSAYIILGTNVGTCFTSVLASIGLTDIARQTAYIHLIFNVVGTIIFFVFFVAVPSSVLDRIFDYLGATPQFKIVNFNLLQNVICTLILLPFTDFIVNISKNPSKSLKSLFKRQ